MFTFNEIASLSHPNSALNFGSMVPWFMVNGSTGAHLWAPEQSLVQIGRNKLPKDRDLMTILAGRKLEMSLKGF